MFFNLNVNEMGTRDPRAIWKSQEKKQETKNVPESSNFLLMSSTEIILANHWSQSVFISKISDFFYLFIFNSKEALLQTPEY